MDLQLGTSTNTKRTQTSRVLTAEGDKKDAERTTKELGFSITGTFAEGNLGNF